MKTFSTMVIRLTVISLSLALLVFAQKQPATPRPKTASPTLADASTQEHPPIRKGRNLVKKLPSGVEGVTLEDGFIKLKQGYKFVQEKNGKASVYLMKDNGGQQVGGSFDCSCASKEKNGHCKLGITTDRMNCFDPVLSCVNCELLVIIDASATGLVSYSNTQTTAH